MILDNEPYIFGFYCWFFIFSSVVVYEFAHQSTDYFKVNLLSTVLELLVLNLLLVPCLHAFLFVLHVCLH